MKLADLAAAVAQSLPDAQVTLTQDERYGYDRVIVTVGQPGEFTLRQTAASAHVRRIAKRLGFNVAIRRTGSGGTFHVTAIR